MSTYGGDSWVPEAMHRKRQVDHLLADAHNLDHDSSQVRRLSNGRLACLVCPHHPVLDSFPVLIVRLTFLFPRSAPLLSFGVIRVMGLICESRMDSCFCLLRMQIGSVRTRFFQSWRQFESHLLTQWDFSSGVDPLWFFHWFFCTHNL